MLRNNSRRAGNMMKEQLVFSIDYYNHDRTEMHESNVLLVLFSRYHFHKWDIGVAGFAQQFLDKSANNVADDFLPKDKPTIS
ncbi:hypothetical protein RND71_023009 [Anisodus tanguticus]|uniref:Uncharacterized protein n=1 Tax=Anisodus tanguticus TaxID=243964 RepID=A0AAE1VDF2_9SOLA|nr:hypothetical protein RND71_023009 [Anisodus tanguticus]